MLLVLIIITACLTSLLLAVVLLIRFYLVVVIVKHESMLPTLAPGDRILAARHWPVQWLRKGWIVLVSPVCYSATRPTLFDEEPYLKRIVALGGETYQADDQEGQTWVVPPGYVFVRGDYRGHSVDSLVWGPLPTRNVLGVILMTLPHKGLAPATSNPSWQKDMPSGQKG